MAEPLIIAFAFVGGVIGLCLFVLCVWVPLVGWAPHRLLRAEAKLIRCIKGKDGRPGSKRFTYNEIEPGVLLGAIPHGADHLKMLRDQENVTCFVTMNELWEMPGNGRTTTPSEVQEHGIQLLWLPTPDYSAVNQEDLRRGANFLEDCVSTGKVCYVHCNGGRGRSTSVVLAWLIFHRQMDALSALRLVEDRRKIANFLCCCGTRPQWRSIRRFETFVHSAKKHKGQKNVGARVAPEPAVEA